MCVCVCVWESDGKRERERAIKRWGRDVEIGLLTAQPAQKLYWLKCFFNNDSVENFLVAVNSIFGLRKDFETHYSVLCDCEPVSGHWPLWLPEGWGLHAAVKATYRVLEPVCLSGRCETLGNGGVALCQSFACCRQETQAMLRAKFRALGPALHDGRPWEH